MRLRLLLLLLLLLTAACGDSGTPAPAPLAAVTPLAWPTLLPTPTAAPVVADDPPPAPPAKVEQPADPTATLVPAAPDEPAWSFVVTGDTWKDTPILRRILSDAQAQGDEFIVVNGDITPQGRPEQFADFVNVISSVNVPVYVAPGNHDTAYSGTTDEFEQYFPRHQSFDRHNLHVTIADDAAHSFSADELAWLENDLAAANQPLKMVFMHVPPIIPLPVPEEEQMQSGGPELMALLEKYKVDAVFTGHLHAYAHFEQGGVSYTITGGGGSPLHVPAILGGRYHYVRVTIKGNNATQQVVWLDDVATPTP